MLLRIVDETINSIRTLSRILNRISLHRRKRQADPLPEVGFLTTRPEAAIGSQLQLCSNLGND